VRVCILSGLVTSVANASDGGLSPRLICGIELPVEGLAEGMI
jgi:hypothetical protein